MQLRERGVKPVTVNTYITALNAFALWLHQEGHAPDRVKLPKLKVEPRVLSVLDDTLVRALIGFKPKTFRQARTHLAVLLILDTGLRLSTIGYIGRNRFAVAGRSTILPIAAQVKYPTR